MGCSGSKLVPAESTGAGDQPSLEKSHQQQDAAQQPPSTTKPRQARLSLAGNYTQYESMSGQQLYDNDDGENELEAISSTGVAIHYAFLSQRGHYPDHLDKANQDAVLVRECINGDGGRHLIGVLDGHGETGAECAQFAKSKVKHRRFFFFFFPFTLFSLHDIEREAT